MERLQGAGARAARGRVRRHRRGDPRERARRLRPPPRRRPAAPRRSKPPTAAAPPAAWSSTTCWCWPARCCATRCRARSSAPPSTSATSGCCSTSSRTPTRSRSSWPCGSPPPIPSTPTRTAGRDVEVAPGRLFVVGDPKQSIYRFRRADISMFLAARDRFAPEAAPVELTANFRTVAPVIDWVNATFRALLEEAPDEDVPDSQPAYVDLQAQRGPAAGRPAGGGDRHRRRTRTRTGADEVRAAESRDVAHVITTALDRGLARRERRPTDERGGRAGSATSRSSSPPAPRCRSSRTPSRRPASPTGPSPARSCTPPGPCATC